MKLYSTPHHGAVHLPSVTHSVEVARNGLGQLVSNFVKGVSNFVTQMQIARMQAALYEMTDKQLASIDLKRSDIRQRAEFLVSGTPEADDFEEYVGL